MVKPKICRCVMLISVFMESRSNETKSKKSHISNQDTL